MICRPMWQFYSGMSLEVRDKQVFRGLTGSQRTPRVWGVIVGEFSGYTFSTEKVGLRRKRLLTAQSRQKSFADRRRQPLKFGSRLLEGDA